MMTLSSSPEHLPLSPAKTLGGGDLLPPPQNPAPSAGMGHPDGEDTADLSSDDSPWSDTAWSEDDDDDEVPHSSSCTPPWFLHTWD